MPRNTKRQNKARGQNSTGVRSNNNQAVIVSTITKQVGAMFRQHQQTYPIIARTNLRWAWTGPMAFAGAGGGATIQTFVLNGLYDPDSTGAGNQPRWFDQFCAASGGQAPYYYYRVIKTHVRVQIINANSTGGTSGICYVLPYQTAALGTAVSFEEYFDTPNCTTMLMSSNGNDNSIKTVELTVDHAKFLGGKNYQDMEDLTGSYSSNPGVQIYLDVGVRPHDDSTEGTVRLICSFVYEVEFFGRQNSGDS